MHPHSCRVICVDTQIVVEMPTEEQVDLAVDTLKLLADGTRLRILLALLHGEHSVNRLAHHIAVTEKAPARQSTSRFNRSVTGVQLDQFCLSVFVKSAQSPR